MITSGSIQCKCNFTAKIENGIYIDERDVRQKTILGKKMPTKKEYLDIASTKYINFYYNGMAKSIDYINKYAKSPKYILELDSCVGSFLMQYIEDLPKESTYILNCYDIERLTNAKTNIELNYSHGNFIFLCCEANQLPIGGSKIDLAIDHGKTNDFYRSHKKELSGVIAHLLKDQGLIVGAFRYVDNKSKDFKTLPRPLQDRYNKDKIIHNLQEAGFQKIEALDIGPVVEDNHLSRDVKGKELFMTVYIGKKS